jgi:hypothetical protein
VTFSSQAMVAVHVSYCLNSRTISTDIPVAHLQATNVSSCPYFITADFFSLDGQGYLPRPE